MRASASSKMHSDGAAAAPDRLAGGGPSPWSRSDTNMWRACGARGAPARRQARCRSTGGTSASHGCVSLQIVATSSFSVRDRHPSVAHLGEAASVGGASPDTVRSQTNGSRLDYLSDRSDRRSRRSGRAGVRRRLGRRGGDADALRTIRAELRGLGASLFALAIRGLALPLLVRQVFVMRRARRPTRGFSRIVRRASASSPSTPESSANASTTGASRAPVGPVEKVRSES